MSPPRGSYQWSRGKAATASSPTTGLPCTPVSRYHPTHDTSDDHRRTVPVHTPVVCRSRNARTRWVTFHGCMNNCDQCRHLENTSSGWGSTYSVAHWLTSGYWSCRLLSPRVGLECCRISPPRFLAECCKKRLNRLVLFCYGFVLFASSELCVICVVLPVILNLSCIFQFDRTTDVL